ncbi:MAG: hypothetical protein MI867_28055, partial [Pseudomonadales bacterium]|nr:hypothetical protein [Pseudomonadales bacterium]
SSTGSWRTGSEEVFTLDLCALPSGEETVNILPKLADHCLEVVVQDDTAVDFLRLTITHCPASLCRELVTETFQAGEEDQFEAPTEPAVYSDVLADYMALRWQLVDPLDFDDCTRDRPFGYTFSGLPPGIIDGNLEISLRCNDNLGTNDEIYINQIVDSGGKLRSFVWGTFLDQITVPSWTAGASAVLNLDLRNLPPAMSGTLQNTAGVTDALGTITRDTLDVFVIEDTCVDYIKLTVTACDDEGGLLLYSWVSNNSGQYSSVVAVDNPTGTSLDLQLTACRADGTTETTARGVPPMGALQESAASLFPNLGSGPGYAVLVQASSDLARGGWVTGNLTAASGFSPSQGVAVRVPHGLADVGERAGKDIIFNYLPEAGSEISVAVLVNL